MRRRDFIGVLGGAVAWPLGALAAGERARRIGVLMLYVESDPVGRAWVGALQEGLGELGWSEGYNIHVDYRWPGAALEQIRHSAKELVGLHPEVILSGGSPATAVLLEQTRTIPIIFANLVDPVGQGFVASFSKPGGNATGFVNLDTSVAGKWIELLKEAAPRVTRAAIPYHPPTAQYFEPLREVVWVILAHFRKAAFCCCSRCGHVGNALALSIMSTAMLASPPSRSVQ